MLLNSWFLKVQTKIPDGKTPYDLANKVEIKNILK